MSIRLLTQWGSVLPQAWSRLVRVREGQSSPLSMGLGEFFRFIWPQGSQSRHVGVCVKQAEARRRRYTVSRGAMVRKKASRDQFEAGTSVFWVSEPLLTGVRASEDLNVRPFLQGCGLGGVCLQQVSHLLSFMARLPTTLLQFQVRRRV